MIDVATIDHAIVAHSKWKERLREAIAHGRSETTVAEASRDDACEFGRWLREYPPSGVDHSRIAELRQLHETFHQEASQVLGLALSHRKHDAEAALASGSRLSRVTTDLVMALTTWRVEVQKHA